MSQAYSFKHFTVQFPADHPYVAHVEINRPDKMNAFFEAWVSLPNSRSLGVANSHLLLACGSK